MTLHYSETHLHEATELLAQQHQILESVKAHKAKIKDGYFSGKEVVLESGLSKADVKHLIDAYDKNEPIVKKIESHKRAFEEEINDAYLAEKKLLETQLAQLKGERDAALKRFPSTNRSVVGSGPYGDLKKAYAEMH